MERQVRNTIQSLIGPTLVSAALVIVVAGGLSSSHAQRRGDQEFAWPAPPDPPRIAYVGVVQSDADIGRRGSMLSRVKRALVGEKEQHMFLSRPHDVWGSPDGRIFVTDRVGGGRLVVFDPKEKEARVIEPTGESRMAKPMGITGDALGFLYVADRSQRRIIKITDQGEFITAYGGADSLLNPVDVATTESGDRVYVADSYLHQIVIFDGEGNLLRRAGRNRESIQEKRKRLDKASANKKASEGTHGKAETSDIIANRGDGDGEFRYPAFVAASRDSVYVSDTMNFRVQVLDRDGNFVRQIGQIGRTPGSFARPKGLGVDSHGHVYVADAAFNNIQIFNGSGALLLSFGSMGGGYGEFWQPLGIAVSDERLYVVDRFNDRIQVFDYLPVAGEADGTSGSTDGKGF